MPYTKQTWHNGPTGNTPINADALGHIEDGVFDAAATADAAAATANASAPVQLQPWIPAEPVAAREYWFSPDSTLIVRIAAGTTRATWDATEKALWFVVGAGSGTVTSVNGKTPVSGAVTLVPSDVGAATASAQTATAASLAALSASLGTASTLAATAVAQTANNGSDFASKPSTRYNLHVGELESAAVSAVTNMALTGQPTIKGYTLTNNDIVFLPYQTTGSQNGPWQLPASGTGAWARPADFPSGGSVKGRSIKIMQDGSEWTLKTTALLTVDTTSQTWVQTNSTAYEQLLSGTIDTATSGTLNADVTALISAAAGAVSRALPTTAPIGSQIVVGKSDSSTNTVTATGKINGVSSSSIQCTVQGETVSLVSDGTGGWITTSGGVTPAYDSRYQLAGTAVGSRLAYQELPTSIATFAIASAHWTDLPSLPLSVAPVIGSRSVEVEACLVVQAATAQTCLVGIYDVTAAAVIGSAVFTMAAGGFATLRVSIDVNPGAGTRSYRPQLLATTGTPSVVVYGKDVNFLLSTMKVTQR